MDKQEINVPIFKKALIIFLTGIGFLTTIKLAIIYYEANFNPYSLPSFCSINQFIDCDGVAQTVHSAFLGIPLALWGMFLYLFIIFLTISDKLKTIKCLKFLEAFKHPLDYIASLGYISFIISIILAVVSVFEIKKVCILCVFTYFLNLLIALIATDFKLGVFNSFKTSFIDFLDALKNKFYLISFLALVLIGSSVLAYTTLSYCFTPQIKRFNELKKYQEMQKDNPFKASGNILGDKNAKLTVFIYTDYECPICRTYNVMICRAAQELSGFQFIHKNLPLDMKCNKNIPVPFHENSCMLAKYSIAAQNQGRLWDLNSELFEKTPKTEAAVLKLAESMGYNTLKLKKEANSKETEDRLQKDITSSLSLGIEGTPAIVINGKVYTGIKPYYELKDILIKSGAQERKNIE